MPDDVLYYLKALNYVPFKGITPLWYFVDTPDGYDPMPLGQSPQESRREERPFFMEGFPATWQDVTVNT